MVEHKYVWQGIGASSGIACGRIWRMPQACREPKQAASDVIDITREIECLAKAVEQTRLEISSSQEQLQADKGEEYAEIFIAHSLILDDPALIPEVENSVRTGISAVEAVAQVGNAAASVLDAMEDEYFRERAADIRAVIGQIMKHLGVGRSATEDFPANGSYIVAADELAPAETIALPKQRVLGFLIRKGGKTSHAAILARTYGIPAVVGAALSEVELDALQYVYLDGDTGRIMAVDEQQCFDEQQATETVDSKTAGSPLRQSMILAANIGLPADVELARQFQAQGVGLYRTEFLFMKESLPGEDEQTGAYRTVIAACSPQMTVIRTLDIGGDKQAPAFNLPPEQNPFLGLRGLRLCLARPAIFQTQLRAIWRASAAGPTAVMFPMVATLEELRQAKSLLETARQSVVADGYPIGDIQIGMMIEVPSAALLARHFAKEVNFLSIGTNDLTQYILAADRDNDSLNQLHQPYHPAVLRLIADVSQAAHAAGIWVGICGEAGGDPLLAPFFAALGIHELSMAPGQLPKIRKKLAALSFAPGDKEAFIAAILDCATQADVHQILSRYGD